MSIRQASIATSCVAEASAATTAITANQPILATGSVSAKALIAATITA